MRKFTAESVEKLVREEGNENLTYQMESEQKVKVRHVQRGGGSKGKQKKHQSDSYTPEYAVRIKQQWEV